MMQFIKAERLLHRERVVKSPQPRTNLRISPVHESPIEGHYATSDRPQSKIDSAFGEDALHSPSLLPPDEKIKYLETTLRKTQDSLTKSTLEYELLEGSYMTLMNSVSRQMEREYLETQRLLSQVHRLLEHPESLCSYQGKEDINSLYKYMKKRDQRVWELDDEYDSDIDYERVEPPLVARPSQVATRSKAPSESNMKTPEHAAKDDVPATTEPKTPGGTALLSVHEHPLNIPLTEFLPEDRSRQSSVTVSLRPNTPVSSPVKIPLATPVMSDKPATVNVLSSNASLSRKSVADETPSTPTRTPRASVTQDKTWFSSLHRVVSKKPKSMTSTPSGSNTNMYEEWSMFQRDERALSMLSPIPRFSTNSLAQSLPDESQQEPKSSSWLSWLYS